MNNHPKMPLLNIEKKQLETFSEILFEAKSITAKYTILKLTKTLII